VGNTEYETLIATKDPDQYWQAVVDSGWTRGLPESEVHRLEKAVRETFKEKDLQPFFGLSVIQLDMEYIEDNGDYSQFVEELAAASFGHFQPSELEDNLHRDEGRAWVAFTLSGKKFELEFDQDEDWVNAEQLIRNLINIALREVGVDKGFYPIPTDSQFADFAFMSEDTFQNARDLGIIPEDDFFLQ